LGAHDGCLFFLPGFVDHERRPLRLLLRDLLRFDGGRELRGEGEVLR
jgi:hypothetical protein